MPLRKAVAATSEVVSPFRRWDPAARAMVTPARKRKSGALNPPTAMAHR